MNTRKIVIDEKIMLGQAHVEGTPLTVEIVLRKLAAGEPVEQILDGYPCLQREDVFVCIDYALALVKKEWELRTGYRDFDPGPIAEWERK